MFRWISEEYNDRRINIIQSEWTLNQCFSCAQQNNGTDCGVYVILFAQLLGDGLTLENTNTNSEYNSVYINQYRIQLAKNILKYRKWDISTHS